MHTPDKESHNSIPPLFPRIIAPGIVWLSTCLNVTVSEIPCHSHNSCFLIIGSERTVLIDTGGPFGWQTLRSDLLESLGARKLDYIFATHPESPHMGNTGPLLEAYPNAKLVGDLRNYELYYPEFQDRFLPLRAGDRLDLGDRELIIVPAVVRDLANSLWGYEPHNKILFVSDGFPYTHEHAAGECAMTSEELPRKPQPKDTQAVIESALIWARYVNPKIIIGELDLLLEAYPTEIIAPAHGAVITNPSEIYAVFKAGLCLAYGSTP